MNHDDTLYIVTRSAQCIIHMSVMECYFAFLFLSWKAFGRVGNSLQLDRTVLLPWHHHRHHHHHHHRHHHHRHQGKLPLKKNIPHGEELLLKVIKRDIWKNSLGATWQRRNHRLSKIGYIILVDFCKWPSLKF